MHFGVSKSRKDSRIFAYFNAKYQVINYTEAMSTGVSENSENSYNVIESSKVLTYYSFAGTKLHGTGVYRQWLL